MKPILAVPESITAEGTVPPAAVARLNYAVIDIPLRSMVHHTHVVDDEQTLEVVYDRFKELEIDFMAVHQRGRVIGLIGRARLGFLMGSRFGFSLYSHSIARKFLLPHCLIVKEDTPIHVLLERSFSRQGDAFYEDVVLVNEAEELVGLINVETLARLQTRLVAEQVGQLEQQHETLREQNLTLFRTNHALRQSRGLYQGLFESEALAVALLSPAGEVELFNPRFADMVGLAPEHADQVGLMDRMRPVEQVEFRGLLAAHHRGLAVRESTREIGLQVPGRRYRTFRVTTGWIRETGQVCACFDDVTEQRALEQMMMREEKQRLLDTLVGGIAHELNNKLTPVLAFAEILRQQVDPKLALHTESIRKSAEEAAKIIHQLLQFSKPAEAEPGAVDLRTVIEETLPIVSVTIRDRCAITVRPATGTTWVQGDKGQLKQVLMNLILNAWHAVAEVPQPRIEVSLAEHAGRVELTVEDNGAGIPPDVLPRIFDPFFTTKGPDKGSGLGLSICFSIARRHGGEITVHSDPGNGARFVVTLPVMDPTVGLAQPRGGAAPTLFLPAQNDRRCRVLVVEDEEVLRGVLREMLRAQFGCELEMAENGRVALAAVRSREYDLIISDIRMPEMNGVEFFHAVRGIRPAQVARFVFVTGYAGAGAVPGLSVPADVPVLAKPFSLKQFQALCGPYLRPSAGSTLPA